MPVFRTHSPLFMLSCLSFRSLMPPTPPSKSLLALFLASQLACLLSRSLCPCSLLFVHLYTLPMHATSIQDMLASLYTPASAFAQGFPRLSCFFGSPYTFGVLTNYCKLHTACGVPGSATCSRYVLCTVANASVCICGGCVCIFLVFYKPFWGISSGVERSLRKGEVRGSIPRYSTFCPFLAILLHVYDSFCRCPHLQLA